MGEYKWPCGWCLITEMPLEGVFGLVKGKEYAEESKRVGRRAPWSSPNWKK